jgi:DNA-binding protein H-NS
MLGIDNFPVRVYPFAGTQFEDQWPMAKSPVSIEELDVEQLGDQELHAMMSRIQGALHGRFSTRTEEFRELAREMGFAVTLTKLGRETSRRGTRHAQKDDRRRGVSAKYRNPDNPEETWAGRGRKPKWVQDRLEQGTPLEELLINRSDAQEQNEAMPEPEYGS